MTSDKSARLIETLGGHMQESAGTTAASDDRFQGFIPSDSASGEMALDRIIEDVDQPRKSYDEQSLKEFAEHLQHHGVQQPIQLRWSEQYGKWLIVYGHRRFRAAKLAGMQSIPCSFAAEETDETTIRIRQLVENCQREDLAPLEMAKGVAALAQSTGWSNRRIGEELGVTHTTINRYVDLLKLPEELQQQVDEGRLAPSVAVELLKIQDQKQQAEIGRSIAENRLNREQAKKKISQAVSPSTRPTRVDRPQREKELLTQTINVAVYRNPDASDFQVQKELLDAAAQLDPMKVES